MVRIGATGDGAKERLARREFGENPEVVEFLRCSGMIGKDFRLLFFRVPA